MIDMRASGRCRVGRWVFYPFVLLAFRVIKNLSPILAAAAQIQIGSTAFYLNTEFKHHHMRLFMK
jgi:hypothetical protein